MKWVLTEPPKKTENDLRQWVNCQISHGVPRQLIWNYLMNWENVKLSFEEKEASMKISSYLLDVMVDKNLNGKNLETQGKVNEAIALYEENISDLFDGSHSYERLRVIYTKRNQLADAIRVCRAYIEIVDMLLKDGSRRSDLNPKRDKFISWIDKLEEKLNNS